MYKDFPLRPRKPMIVSAGRRCGKPEKNTVWGEVTKSNSELISEHHWASVRVGGGKSSQFGQKESGMQGCPLSHATHAPLEVKAVQHNDIAIYILRNNQRFVKVS